MAAGARTNEVRGSSDWGTPLGLSELLKPIVDCPQDRGVGDGAVVEGCAVDDGNGVEQASALDLVDERFMLPSHVRRVDVVVEDRCRIAETALHLGADDRGIQWFAENDRYWRNANVDEVIGLGYQGAVAKASILEVSAKNREAVALYVKLGYAKDALLQDYYGPGKDALLMMKMLNEKKASDAGAIHLSLHDRPGSSGRQEMPWGDAGEIHQRG